MCVCEGMNKITIFSTLRFAISSFWEFNSCIISSIQTKCFLFLRMCYTGGLYSVYPPDVMDFRKLPVRADDIFLSLWQGYRCFTVCVLNYILADASEKAVEITDDFSLSVSLQPVINADFIHGICIEDPLPKPVSSVM